MTTASEDPRQLWQRQAQDAPRITLPFVRQRVDALQKRARARIQLEYLFGSAGVAWVAFAGWNMLLAHPILMAAAILWAFAVFWIMFQWHRRASAAQAPAELGVLDAFSFYRQQLEKQRDARRDNWRWWVPPLIPGLLVCYLSLFVEVKPTPWLGIALMSAWVVVSMSLGIFHYQREARRLQREIDALDSMKLP